MDIEEVCHSCQRTLLSTDFEWAFYSCGHFICPHCISACSSVCSCKAGWRLPNLTISSNEELKNKIKWCLRARFYEPLSYRDCMEQLRAYIVQCVVCSQCNSYISQHSPCPNCSAPVPNWVCPKCNSPISFQSLSCLTCEKPVSASEKLILETPIGCERDIAIGTGNLPKLPGQKEDDRHFSTNAYNEDQASSQHQSHMLSEWICACGVKNNYYEEKCRWCSQLRPGEHPPVEREKAKIGPVGELWNCPLCNAEGLREQMCGFCGANRPQPISISPGKQQASQPVISLATSSGEKAACEIKGQPPCSRAQFPQLSSPPKPATSYFQEETNSSKVRAASMAESRNIYATVTTAQMNTSGSLWICESCEFKSNRIGSTICFLCRTPKSPLTREKNSTE